MRVGFLAKLGKLIAGMVLLGFAHALWAVDEAGNPKQTVKVIADARLQVNGANISGLLPLYLSHDWMQTQPQLTRAVLVFHGRLRDADVYLRSSQQAFAQAGAAAQQTMLIVPQFLNQHDIREHQPKEPLLHWLGEMWMGGAAALQTGVSSFEAIDAILLKLADKKLFPNLNQIVVAGHSGGAQVVQRYAVVGRAEEALKAQGLAVRYVVANPSSYVYLSGERPVLSEKSSNDFGVLLQPKNLDAFNTKPVETKQIETRVAENNLTALRAFTFQFAPVEAARVSTCPDFNQWKFGWENAGRYAPLYAQQQTPQSYAQNYAERDVIYLLGTQDIDPNHSALDKSCAAQTQGRFRLERGLAYVQHVRLRLPQNRHRTWLVPGVAHEGDRMLTSTCGLAALFDQADCPQ